jgi:chemotaxis protein CheD
VADLATSPAADVVVRMGELAVSGAADDVLVSVGLGSCIGLALVSRRGGACGLAHVMLPDSAGRPVEKHGKFADTAVPALLAALAGHGVPSSSLDAILVGGAQMFAAASGLEIGARNEAAVRAALAAARIPIAAAATSGNIGRTIRVHVASGSVTVREAGAKELELR